MYDQLVSEYREAGTNIVSIRERPAWNIKDASARIRREARKTATVAKIAKGRARS